ncbi:hypothetical protein QSH18_00350 [Xanthomonas sp. NCPPB 2654]|uniref:hypothetical protein n=1 Tax=unclassified Xanthomonas TaxID=2643310 RepID=UPI0021E086C1|nr:MULTISPECIES: hypothetical protein [unclassified Xanthomonas]MDL5364051.1 hypothetical protein [Xanthomonas sp. NCPPB 2654]UYC20949.1 hypothetical protein NUG20_01165 [Xanthomonas sp. CFBP 8443]
MPSHGGTYLVVNAGSKTYYRWVNNYTDAQEKAFIIAAKLAEAGGVVAQANTVRTGAIRRKVTQPTSGTSI